MATVDEYVVVESEGAAAMPEGLAVTLGLRNPEEDRDELGEWADVRQIAVAPDANGRFPASVAEALVGPAREKLQTQLDAEG